MPKGLRGFQKGHKLNLDNQYAKGMKHTEEWKKATRLRMLGNKKGFQKGHTGHWLGKKFSEEHRKNLGEAHIGLLLGENHPNWKGNLRKKKDKRNDPAYKYWVRQIKRRDKQCMLKNENCDGYLVVHHIKSWAEYPDLRYELTNGITLCQGHHPRKRNDEKQLMPRFMALIGNNV